MGQPELLPTGLSGCPICTGDSCIGFPDTQHRHDYPFIGGGVDHMAQEPYVIATRRIDDPELERAVYGVGDRVPMTDAIKYGLITAEQAAEQQSAAAPANRKAAARAKPGPQSDRAKKPREDRGK